MKSFATFALVQLLLLSLSLGADSTECEQKGFSPSLLCSSCDKLSAFVGDSTGTSIRIG